MNDILFQVPNWVDQIGVVVMATLFVACEVLVVLICVWALAEITIAIYERLRGRIMRLSL